MAFALTAYRSYAVPSYEALTQQFTQVVELTITRAATDTALDIGNVSGTFWSAADDTALGASALANFKCILGKARAVLNITSPEVENALLRDVAAPATGEYRLAAATPTGIAYTFFSGDALTPLKVFIVFSLNAGELPAEAETLT